MSRKLVDRVAIVTGAGSVGPGWGNGRAIAVRFAEEGAKVFAVDNDADRLTETLARVRDAGGTIASHICNVTDSAALAGMTKACLDLWGRIDILVNNVGGSAAGGPVEMARGRLGCTDRRQPRQRVPQPQACAAGDGASGSRPPSSTSRRRRACAGTGSAQVAYAATKAGVIQLGRVVAVQYASKGIRVNTVVPGQLHTPMVEARLAGQRTGGDVAGLLKTRQARIPLGFMGDGRDTANAVLFLVSDEARFVTGTEIVVDGGMTVRCD